MTEVEIMKALECCSKDDCDNCPNDFGNCYTNLAQYALDLINRKNAEIERLEREIENLESIQEISPEAKHFVDTKADKVISLLNEVIKSQEQIKSEAIKEFAEKAEKRICEKVNAPTPTESWIVEKCIEVIDRIAKEMGVEV